MKRTYEKNALQLFICYALWGFVFKNTVFKSQVLVYASLALLFTSFGLGGMRTRYITLPTAAKVWIPYLFLTIAGYIFVSDYEKALYWGICLLIVLFSYFWGTIEIYPNTLLLVSGVLAIAGIFVQILLPSFYSNRIASLFSTDVMHWAEKNYGYAGITYQTGTTATILLYGMVAWLFWCWKREGKSKNIEMFGYLLFVFGILLTGKRMMLLIAVIAPIFVTVYCEIDLNSRVKKFLLIFLAILMGGIFVITNIDYLAQHPYFSRISRSVYAFQAGEDITTGRAVLYEKAFELFLEHPFIGIGQGQFITKSGTGTDVHNAFLQALCEQGILGFTCLIIPVFYCFAKTVKYARFEENSSIRAKLKASLMLQTVYILAAFTANPNINLLGYAVYFLAISMLCDYDYIIKKEKTAEKACL